VTQWTGLPDADQVVRFSRGVLGEPFDPRQVGSGTTLTSQAIVGALIPLYAGDVASGIGFLVTQAGTGTPPTNFFGALYDLAGNRLAVTADSAASTSLTTAGYQSLNFSTAYTCPTTGSYYGCIMMNGAFGTQAFNAARLAGGTGVGGAVGSNAKVAVTQTAQTTMPSTATFTAVDVLWYVYLK
jgi:hypothetical protein